MSKRTNRAPLSPDSGNLKPTAFRQKNLIEAPISMKEEPDFPHVPDGESSSNDEGPSVTSKRRNSRESKSKRNVGWSAMVRRGSATVPLKDGGGEGMTLRKETFSSAQQPQSYEPSGSSNIVHQQSSSEFPPPSENSDFEGQSQSISEAESVISGGTSIDEEKATKHLNCVQRALAHIPFYIQVLMLMSVPIIFLAVYRGIDFVPVYTQYNFAREYSPLLQQILVTHNYLQAERGATNNYIAWQALLAKDRGNISTADQVRRLQRNMLNARVVVNDRITDLIRASRRKSLPAISVEWVAELRALQALLSAVRFNVDNDVYTESAVVAQYTEGLSVVEDGVQRLSLEGFITVPLFQIVQILEAKSQLGMCRFRVYAMILLRDISDDRLSGVRVCNLQFDIHNLELIAMSSLKDQSRLTDATQYHIIPTG
jgi:hypothetical protein